MQYLGDIADIIDDAVEALQQYRYGNESEAKLKLIQVSAAALRVYNEMSGITIEPTEVPTTNS